MIDVVLFPDAAAVAITYLRDELEDRGLSAVVAHEVPDPRPDDLVTVHRGGGIRHTVVSDAPLLIVECWGETSEAAHDLAQLCRALLHAAEGQRVDGIQIYRVDEAGGPVELPDPLSEKPRYTFTVEAHMRGAAESAS